MRKEKSNLRTRSREGTNIQQTSDREREGEGRAGAGSVHAPLISSVPRHRGCPREHLPLLLYAGTHRWPHRPGFR